MARRVKTTTAKDGATPVNRRVLTGVTSSTSEPALSSDGHLLEQNEIIHLLFTVTGTDPVFRIRIWWYSTISGEWHKGNQVVVNANDLVTIEAQGLNRVYLQVETTPSGTSPVINAWIAMVRPV